MMQNKHLQKVLSLLVAMVMLLAMFPLSAITVSAATTAEFAGGSGTEEDPYLIETKEHLNNVRKYLDAHYKMVADIVFTEADFSANGKYYGQGRGWTPICNTEYNSFTGLFDGDGHVIKGLQLTRFNATSYAGLFGCCNGTIKNLGIIDSTIAITAQDYEWVYVGGIAGYAGSECTILNCWSDSTITACTLDSAPYSRAYAGGIIGTAEDTATISCCYNVGSVNAIAPGYASFAFSGGIVGALSDGGIINNSQVLNCYNVGNIAGDGDSGGIIGRMWQGTVKKCYNVGSINGENIGSITGYVDSKAIVTDNFYLSSVLMAVGNSTNNGTNQSCTPQQMESQSTFTDFDFITTWEFAKGNDYLYPTLQNNKHYVINDAYEFLIVFKNSDGSILSEKSYRYGNSITVPDPPTKLADNTYTYTFAGWDKEVVNCASNTTYTATYTPTYIGYAVVFKNWNGDVISEKTYHWDDEITIPADPTKAADNTYTYTFNGWDSEVVNCAGDATYTATYTKEYIDYTVEFKDWNGNVLSTKTYHYGDTVTAPANPTRPDDSDYTYTFTGWDKTVTSCTGNAIYTAQYQRIAHQNGWVRDGVWYYYVKGVKQTDWQRIDGTWYYFTSDGAMVTGWQWIGNTWYYFHAGGNMATDWQLIGGTWYYFGGSGAMATGWQLIGGVWYYFGGSGAMATGWQLIGGVWYYFGGSGAMATGWQLIGGTWYYFHAGGNMATGWLDLGGTWYYLYSSGAMAANTYIDGYWINASGVWHG